MLSSRKNDKEKWQEDVLEVYYQESRKTLEDLSGEGVPLEESRRYFRRVAAISALVHKVPEESPSPWVASRILAHAREKVDSPSWIARLIPLRFASVVALGVGAVVSGLLAWQALFPVSAAQDGWQALAAQKIIEVPSVSHDVRFGPLRPYFVNSVHPVGQSLTMISPVAVGESLSVLGRDPLLDEKILTRSPLTQEELESLFFRARKSQQMGYYREAIRDFQFIARFYPEFKQTRSIQLAIASCYAALEKNEKAITVLQSFEKNYGGSEELELWIDELKSESF